jgi:hypothetical protein
MNKQREFIIIMILTFVAIFPPNFEWENTLVTPLLFEAVLM